MKKTVIKKEATVKIFNSIKKQLCKNFIERGRIIPVLMGLHLAKQNALLLGPPGTAKSALAEAVCHSMGADDYFRYLLTRYTTPEEIYGPFSLSAIKLDKFSRKTGGYLPSSKVAFLDEIWKANSSILNSLLTIMNEREFFDDGKRIKVPLRMVVGASNELPDGAELDALYDRFIYRVWIDPLKSKSAKKAVMTGTASAEPAREILDDSQIEDLSDLAGKTPYANGVADIIITVEQELSKNHGITITDRRRRQIYKTLPFLAFAFGDKEVTEDLLVDILPDMIWKKPEQRSIIFKTITKIANPAASKAQEIIDAAKQLIDELENQKKEVTETSSGSVDFINLLPKIKTTRDEIAKMSERLLVLSNGGKNFRVTNSIEIMKGMYSGIMSIFYEAAGMEAFAGDTVTKKMDEAIQ